MAICGVDEAGRGPLAGPVVAAAVIFDTGVVIEGVADSKSLSSARRLQLFSEIIEKAAAYAIAEVSNQAIDRINILQASLMAMRMAVEKLPVKPDRVLVDGKFEIPQLNISQKALVGGDGFVPEISAASILAKVARDSYMIEASKKYPGYGFERNKGYATKEHLDKLSRLGPCPIHRRSFKPVSQLLLWVEN